MISTMPEIEMDDEAPAQNYSQSTQQTSYQEPPTPDPFTTSSFSARTVRGAYESRFTDLQFGQNKAQTNTEQVTEKEEVKNGLQ